MYARRARRPRRSRLEAAVEGELSAIEQALEEVRFRVARDPLGASKDLGGALTPRLTALSSRLGEEASLRRRVEEGLVHAAKLSEELRATHRGGGASGRAHPARGRRRASSGERPSTTRFDPRARAMVGPITRLSLRRAQRWRAAGRGLARWREAAEGYLQADGAIAKAHAALVGRREELRGRLAARRAQASSFVARGAPLDPQVRRRWAPRRMALPPMRGPRRLRRPRSSWSKLRGRLSRCVPAPADPSTASGRGPGPTLWEPELWLWTGSVIGGREAEHGHGHGGKASGYSRGPRRLRICTTPRRATKFLPWPCSGPPVSRSPPICCPASRKTAGKVFAQHPVVTKTLISYKRARGFASRGRRTSGPSLQNAIIAADVTEARLRHPCKSSPALSTSCRSSWAQRPRWASSRSPSLFITIFRPGSRRWGTPRGNRCPTRTASTQASSASIAATAT